MRTCRGFTLVETIIVITIVGILVAMYAPSLRGVRDAAHEAESLANLRSHVAVFAQYTSDYDDMFPVITSPDDDEHLIVGPDRTFNVGKYFGGYALWHVALANGYYAGNWRSDAFYPEGARDEPYTPYWYSAAFRAAPEFWNPATRTGPRQWGPVLASDVHYTSAKGLLIRRSFWEGGTVYMGPSTISPEVGFVDGSARVVPKGELTAPYTGGEGNWDQSWFSIGLPVMHTRDGARGRDVK